MRALAAFLLFCGGNAAAQSFLGLEPMDRISAAAVQPDHAFDAAVRGFERHIYWRSWDVKNDANLPFILTHGSRAAKSVLMIHGLTDSPYYMRALADVFFNRGYNVVGILLPGHGTNPARLLDIQLWQWRNEVEYGLKIAEQLGGEVALAGFSTGGALALDAIAKNEERRFPRQLGGLYLFSPAIQIANPQASQACTPGAPLLRPWVQENADQIEENNPYRYNKMATHAVCQLYLLTQDNLENRVKVLQAISSRHIPVFAVQSQADTTVSPQAVDEFMRDAGGDYVSYPVELHIAHADVTRPETNPNYADLQAHLSAFLTRLDTPVPALRRHAFSAPRLDVLRTSVLFQ